MSTWNAPPNWPQPEPGWRPPPGWKPDPAWGPAPEGWQFERGEGTGPQGKAGGGGFLRKKGVQLAGAGLAGLLLGSIIGGSGGSGGDDTATTAAEGADPAEVTELQRQLAVANKRVQDAEAAAKAQPPAPAAPVAPAAPPPPPPPPPAAPPPAAAGLKDGSFSSANPILKEQLGTFGGTAGSPTPVARTSRARLSPTRCSREERRWQRCRARCRTSQPARRRRCS